MVMPFVVAEPIGNNPVDSYPEPGVVNGCVVRWTDTAVKLDPTTRMGATRLLRGVPKRVLVEEVCVFEFSYFMPPE